MKEFDSYKTLKKRKKVLVEYQNKANLGVRNRAQGKLRVLTTSSGYTYYHIKERGNSNGVYLRRKDLKVARRIAQRDYSAKVIKEINSEMPLLDALIDFYENGGGPEAVFQTLHPGRQVLVDPIVETDEQFVAEWKAQTFDELGSFEGGRVYEAKDGTRLRSKSEYIIYEELGKAGVAFFYEKPIYLDDGKPMWPDFTILDVEGRREIYWEHLGMMDDPAYCARALEKIEIYERNGIVMGDNLIVTAESSMHPLDVKTVRAKIKRLMRE